jgi:hypothetical protein
VAYNSGTIVEAEEWMNDVAVQEGTAGGDERMTSVRSGYGEAMKKKIGVG